MSMPISSEAVATIAFSSPALQPLLGRQADLARQAAVMAGDGVLAQQFAQVVRHALGQPPRVDEDQRAAMRGDQLGQPRVDLGPLFVRADGRQLAGRHFDAPGRARATWPVSMMRQSGVPSASIAIGADQKAGDLVDRPLRGRQSDAHRRPWRRAASSRSSDSARCEPRLSRARA